MLRTCLVVSKKKCCSFLFVYMTDAPSVMTSLAGGDTRHVNTQKTVTFSRNYLLASGQTGAPFFVTSQGHYTLRKKCFHHI